MPTVFNPEKPLGPVLFDMDVLVSVESKRTRSFEYPVVCTPSMTILWVMLINAVITIFLILRNSTVYNAWSVLQFIIIHSFSLSELFRSTVFTGN